MNFQYLVRYKSEDLQISLYSCLPKPILGHVIISASGSIAGANRRVDLPVLFPFLNQFHHQIMYYLCFRTFLQYFYYQNWLFQLDSWKLNRKGHSRWSKVFSASLAIIDQSIAYFLGAYCIKPKHVCVFKRLFSINPAMYQVWWDLPFY